MPVLVYVPPHVQWCVFDGQGENIFKTWSKRYFRISTSSLAYYLGDSDRNTKTGEVEVHTILRTYDEVAKPLHFHVDTPKRKYILYAPSTRVKIEWLYAIDVARACLASDDKLLQGNDCCCCGGGLQCVHNLESLTG